MLFECQKDAKAPLPKRHAGDVLDAYKNHRKTQKPYQQEKSQPGWRLWQFFRINIEQVENQIDAGKQGNGTKYDAKIPVFDVAKSHKWQGNDQKPTSKIQEIGNSIYLKLMNWKVLSKFAWKEKQGNCIARGYEENEPKTKCKEFIYIFRLSVSAPSVDKRF